MNEIRNIEIIKKGKELRYEKNFFIKQESVKKNLEVGINPKHVNFLMNNSASEEVISIPDRIFIKTKEKREFFLHCDLALDMLMRGMSFIATPIFRYEPKNISDFIFDFNKSLSKSFINLNISGNLLVDGRKYMPMLNTLLPIHEPKTLEAVEEFKNAMKIYYEVFNGMVGGNDDKKKIEYKIPEIGIPIVANNKTEKGQSSFLESKKVKSDISFENIGGYEELKEEMRRIAAVKNNPEAFRKLGVKAPSSILLYGPPGTGKTLFAKALAKEIKGGMYNIKTSDIFEKWVGASGRNITKILESLPKNSILFIDEIDSLMRDRNKSDEHSAEVLNLILQFMDGTEDNKGILFVGATNKKELLDAAALRAGRFGKHIEVGLPDKKARESIFKVHIRDNEKESGNQLFRKNINFEKIVSISENLSGGDIGEIIERCIEERAFSETKNPITTSVIEKVINNFKKERSTKQEGNKIIGFNNVD